MHGCTFLSQSCVRTGTKFSGGRPNLASKQALSSLFPDPTCLGFASPSIKGSLPAARPARAQSCLQLLHGRQVEARDRGMRVPSSGGAGPRVQLHRERERRDGDRYSRETAEDCSVRKSAGGSHGRRPARPLRGESYRGVRQVQQAYVLQGEEVAPGVDGIDAPRCYVNG